MTAARSRPLGILILCLWSLVLTIEIVVRIGLGALRRIPSHEWVFSLTLPLSAAGALCAAALIVSCVGLWKRRAWARPLFLAQITVYYGLLLIGSIALWGPVVGTPIGQPGQGWVTMVLLEGALGLGFGWWYLNRASVRNWFLSTTPSRPDVPGSKDGSGEAEWE